MNKRPEEIKPELDFVQPNISDQISGKLFPDTPVKPGTRWFYVILLIIVLGSIAVQAVSAISLLLSSYK